MFWLSHHECQSSEVSHKCTCHTLDTPFYRIFLVTSGLEWKTIFIITRFLSALFCAYVLDLFLLFCFLVDNMLLNWLLTADMSVSTTQQTESSAQSDGGELKVQMSMVKPEIILVEDAAELKTEALMMTVSPQSFLTAVCHSLMAASPQLSLSCRIV